MAKLSERITVDPEQCGGRPCIRGMRIRVTDVLDQFAQQERFARVVTAAKHREWGRSNSVV